MAFSKNKVGHTFTFAVIHKHSITAAKDDIKLWLATDRLTIK